MNDLMSAIVTKPIYHQHMVVYDYIEPHITGKNVLEIGCNEGFGAALLAKKAKYVLGVDCERELIETAKEENSAANVEFLREDVNYLCLEPGSFDVVVAFHFIEHFDDPDYFLTRVRRWLKPGGLLILSTPNREQSLSYDRIPLYPYHHTEYTKAELLTLLGRYFPLINIYGVKGKQKVEALREKKRQRIGIFKKLGLTRLYTYLPLGVRKRIFTFMARTLNKKIYDRNRVLVKSITNRDYWISNKPEDAIDFIALCKKEDI